MKSEVIRVNQHKIFELIPHQTTLVVAHGSAVYKMSRGTFKTKDKIVARKTLVYTEKNSTVYTFTDGDVKVYMTVSKDSHTVLTFKVPKPYNRLQMTLNAHAEERLYGCGEQFTQLNLKGSRIPIWVSEHHSVKKLLKKTVREKLKGVNFDHIAKLSDHQTYYAQPTFRSSLCYVVHADIMHYAEFDFQSDQTILAFREIPKSITFIEADNHLTLSQKLSDLLGKQPRLPTWTEQGAIIAPQGGTKTIDATLEKALAAGAKVAGIWSQDWSGHLTTSFGHQVLWNWTLDQGLYADLPERIKVWRSKGIHFLGYINTFLKEHSPLYNHAKSNNFLVKNKKGLPYLIKSTTFNAGIMDLTHPEAYEWVKSIIKTEMIDIGMSGWMADFGEYLPTDAVISAGNSEAWHNLWPALWAKVNAEAIQESERQDELFFFTRAGFTDTIRYSPSMWCGDQHVDFSDEYGLPSVIPATLSMACIGVGVAHSDIGGYTTIFHMRRSPELMIRWAEMNVFSPIFRCHEGNRPWSNAQFDHPEVFHHFIRLSQLFHLLSPYLSALKTQYEQDGIPVIRPLFFHVDEPFAYDEKRAYMYGPDIIVYPITRPNMKEIEVTLPKGKWQHLITQNLFQGGTHKIACALGAPTAFYRQDSDYKTLFYEVKTLYEE